MSLRPATPEALALLMQGVQSLSRMEATGLRIDVAYLEETIKAQSARIADMETELRAMPEYRLWAKHYGNKMCVGNTAQLGHVIFKLLGHKRNPQFFDRKKNKEMNSAAAFEHLDLPFIKQYFRIRKLTKARTDLQGMRREVVNGRIHPDFGLHTAESYRSSCSRINFQNQQVRDKEIARIVRTCVIPSKGRVFLEVDYVSHEVRMAACYNKDPKLISYVTGGGDMHTDMAKELFLLGEAPSKESRYCAKNMFVFAQFYGSVFSQCAPKLWDGIARLGLKRQDGVPLFQHLKEQGIKKLGTCDYEKDAKPGTFEFHVKAVERRMWDETFSVYNQWRKDWWALYQSQGGVNTLTGFRMEGVFRRNQIFCDPIQGCLQGHSRVLTKNGLIPIRELEGKQTEVWTGFDWSSAVGICKGQWELARIHLSSGLVIQCDTRHRFKNELREWVDFKDLKVGDNVALPNCPIQLDLFDHGMNWWFVYGFIIGDGCLQRRSPDSSSPNGRFLTIVVGEKKKSCLERIRDFLISEGYSPGWYVVPEQDGRAEKYGLRLENVKFADFLEKQGFSFDWKSLTKRIPESVWRASFEDQRDFMEGLWLSDGGRVQYQEKNLHMSNHILLKEVQILISHLGYDSHLCETNDGWLLRVHERRFNSKPFRKYPRNGLGSLVTKIEQANYESYQQFNNDASAFYRKTGEISQYIGERIILRNSECKEVYRFDQVVKIEVLGKSEQTYTMSVNDPLHQFVADGVICKNSAFHCLLWSIIQIQKELRRRQMKSRIVMEIHDSMLFDAVPDEVPALVEICQEVMVDQIADYWDWFTVPLAIEVEICHGSWAEKKPMEMKA